MIMWKCRFGVQIVQIQFDVQDVQAFAQGASGTLNEPVTQCHVMYVR